MFKFRMQHIKVDQFAILEEKLPTTPIQLETSLGLGANKEHRMITAQLKVTFSSESNILVVLMASCLFEIHPDTWNELSTEGKTIIPKNELAHLAMHTFGTVRGILFCKTEGTNYQQLILPPTNVESMIKEPLVIE